MDEKGWESNVTGWVLTVTFPVTILLGTLRQDILTLFHSSHTDDTNFMVIRVIASILNCAFGRQSVLAAITGHSGWNLLNDAVVTLTSVLFNLLFIPSMGLLGVALVSALALAILSALEITEARVIVKVRMSLAARLPLVIAGRGGLSLVGAWILFAGLGRVFRVR